jgi:hypothetical protein
MFWGEIHLIYKGTVMISNTKNFGWVRPLNFLKLTEPKLIFFLFWTYSQEKTIFLSRRWYPGSFPTPNFLPLLCSPSRLLGFLRQGLTMKARLAWNLLCSICCLKPVNLWPQGPKCWDYKHVTSWQAQLNITYILNILWPFLIHVHFLTFCKNFVIYEYKSHFLVFLARIYFYFFYK